jgi:hypothetical protein
MVGTAQARVCLPYAGEQLHLLHPAPFRDEQRGRFRRLPQRVQIDIFIEPVHRGATGAEAQARDVVVQAVKPGIGERCEGAVLDRTPIDRGIGLAESGFRLGGIRQFIPLRQEARPFHHRRIVGEEAMVARG